MASQLPRLVADAEQAVGRKDWTAAVTTLRAVIDAVGIMLVSFLLLFALGLFVSVDEGWPTLGESPWTRAGLAAGFGLIFMWPLSGGLDWLSRVTDVARPFGKAPSPPMARQLLESARADLEEAQHLDPALEGVKQNLVEIKGILGRLLPEPKTKKRSKRR